MNRSIATCMALGVLLSTGTVLAAPPAKPLPINATQFAALRALQQQPEHQQVLSVRATFQSEREKKIEKNLKTDDITTAATFFAYPGAVLLFLIAAAPL